MKADYLIRNGRVIDPARGIDEIRDVATSGNRIIDAGDAEDAINVIDAEGCIVTPGLIDYHSHIFYDGAFSGTNPTLFAAQGVTATVDAGTAGSANYDAFHRTVVTGSPLRIRSYLLPFAAGQVSFSVPENYDPAKFDVRKIRQLFEQYPDELLGLKIKFSKGILPDGEETAISYLKGLRELADSIPNCRICIHVTNAAAPVEQIAELLRPGDIYCHMYAGQGYNIYGDDGKIKSAILDARKRGVLFDASNGFSNFSIQIAEKALQDCFIPDIISTDITSMHANRPGYVKNLPYVMSKYLNLGLDMNSVIRAVTDVPAKAMNLEGRIGTLQEGAYADIAILKEKTAKVVFRDIMKESRAGDRLLVPQFTLLNGYAAYCQTDFWND